MLKVIGHPRSRAMRVVWMLEELGEPYELDPCPPQGAAIRVVNPAGKIPALVMDEEVLLDSVAIVTFLADRAGRFTAPAGTLARARQDAATQFCVDEVEGALWLAGRHSFVLPEDKRVPQVKETARWEFARAMATLERRLKGSEFVAGDGFSVPDLLLGHAYGWAKAAKFETPETGPLADYFARLRARPAFRAAMERAAACG
jgi:glutathione S-transferase